jgi:hypothetical protein
LTSAASGSRRCSPSPGQGGLSIILINFLFRMGQASDREHEEHEEAWRFFERHGHWPDEQPPR